LETRYRVLRQNIKNNMYNGIAWSIGFNFVTPFIGVIAAHLAATNTDYALLSSVPALLTIIATLPASIIIEKFKHQKRIVAGIILLSRTCYLFLAMIPLFHFNKIYALILLVGIYNATNTIISVAYQSMMGEIIPSGYRNRVFFQRNIWSSVFGMTAALLAGWGIDVIAYPYGFQLAYILGFFAAMIETFYFIRLRIPSEETKYVRDIEIAIKSQSSMPFWSRMVGVLKGFQIHAGRPFYLFCFSALIFIFAWQAAWPIYLKIKVDVLHFSNMMMSIDTVSGAIGGLVGFGLWARFSDRYSNGITVFFSAFLLAITPILWIYAPTIVWVSVYDFIGGFVTAGFTQSVFNRLLEIVPEKTRQKAIAFYTSLAQISAIFAPIVGMKIFERFPFWSTMSIISAARILGSLCFFVILTSWFNKIIEAKAKSNFNG
jgi:MFS family permease